MKKFKDKNFARYLAYLAASLVVLVLSLPIAKLLTLAVWLNLDLSLAHDLVNLCGPFLVFGVIYSRHWRRLELINFLKPSAFAIAACLVLVFASAQENQTKLLLEANNFGLAFREQLVFFSTAVLIPNSRIKFLFASFFAFLSFLLIHDDPLMTILPTIFLLGTWIYTAKVANIWLGAFFHYYWNVIVDLSSTDFLSGTGLSLLIDEIIILVLFSSFFFMVFASTKYTINSITIFRLFFPFQLGRLLLAMLLWIFQTPQDLWRKYVRREPNFEYGARIIMNALRKDIAEHPFQLRKPVKAAI